MPMKDSIMSDAWIAKAVASNPFTKLPNGSIRSCPVRLAYTALINPYKRRANDAPDKKPSWGCAVLLPPGVEDQIKSVLYPEWLAACRAKHPKQFDAQGNPFGLHWPIHPAAEKQSNAGYTPGLFYFDSSTNMKPPVVDLAHNPIITEEQLYSGVWAFVCLNVYAYDNLKKGASFGLQSVMKIADDSKLFTSGVDSKTAFEGVQIDSSFDAAAAFGAGGPAAAAGPGLPGMGGGLLPPPQVVAPPPGVGSAADYI